VLNPTSRFPFYKLTLSIKKTSMKPKFWLSLLTLTIVVATIQTAQAQTYQPTNRTPVADKTLDTQVSSNGNNFDIKGGLSRGQTLFHSFTDFSIPTNGQANFLNPVGNRDIITRVTGNLFSDINGLLKTNGANFLLINPNGVVFGTNAQLNNVGKAFVGSTANSIDLTNAAGKTFSFGVSGAGDAALLTVNSNVLFNPSKLVIGGNIPGRRGIENYGTLKTSNDSQYIGLIGGNVTISGGGIVAPGGRVDLGGLNSAGTISINNQGLGFAGNNLTRSDVSLLNGAKVDVAANQVLGTVNTFASDVANLGSRINITANNVQIVNDKSTANAASSALIAGLNQNSGTKTTTTGGIDIDVTGKLSLNNSNIVNTLASGSEGSLGIIKIQASTLELKNQSNISAENIGGKGTAGNIDIKTTGDIRISGTDNRSIIPGNEGTVLSSISSGTKGQGNTGKIMIDTKGNLLLDNRSAISSSITDIAVGTSQGVNIAAKNIRLSNLSDIQASNFSGKGNGGNINIKTTGDLTILGTDDLALRQSVIKDMPLSEISSFTNGIGDTGKIIIDVQGNLAIADRGGIFATILDKGIGNSQGVKVQAGNINLTNFSTIESVSYAGGTGNSGDVDITSKGDINLTANSKISSSSIGQGEAANILVNANRIRLNNSSIVAIAPGTKGGNIQMTLNDQLLLRNTSKISTTSDSTGKNGDGGNITINSPLIIAAPGTNNISANAFAGNGGKVNITSQGLFGIQYRPIGLDTANNITASSTFGQSGAVSITTPGADPGKDSTELPNVTTDASNQISQACSASNRQNKLTVTGRGGLPPNANDPLTSDVVWQDARAARSQPAAVATTNPARLTPPAVSWVFDGKGKVTLVAASTQGQPTGTSVICPTATK
jgi:filamentous hemagglutinin family protein